MVTETPFFILGLPRTRTAWLSVVVSMCGRLCFHEGMRDFVSFEDYAQNREATGDADPTLIYWTARLLEEWPEARFVVVNRDSEEALEDFVLASPPELGGDIRAGWERARYAFAVTRDLLRENGNAFFVEYDQLGDANVIADLVEHVGGGRPSLAAVERWQRLRVTSHIINPDRIVAPRLTAMPDLRLRAGDICDVSGLSAVMYETTDFTTVAKWWRSHTQQSLQESSLPPLGVMVMLDGEAVAACWCYESYGVPVAELTFPVTKPGLSVKDARRSLLYAVSCLISAAGKGYIPEASYSTFKVLAPAGMARVLKRMGFQSMLIERKPLILSL